MTSDREADAADLQEQAAAVLEPDEEPGAPDPDVEADLADVAEQQHPVPPADERDEQ